MSNKELPITQRWLADVIAGSAAGLALSPFITPMDAAVTASMSGKTTLLQSLTESGKEILTKPHRYALRPEFKVILGVYASTYGTKNAVESYCEVFKKSNEETAFWKFWLVLFVNGSLCVFWRDPAFAKIFGTKAPTSVPALSYSLWVTRDIAHTLGAVVAPDYVESAFKLTKDQWKMCQLTFPLLVQFITTPLHLLGLDYYNIKEDTLGKRVGRVAGKYVPTVGIRMVRMFPPWSVGLIVNRSIRDSVTDAFRS